MIQKGKYSVSASKQFWGDCNIGFFSIAYCKVIAFNPLFGTSTFIANPTIVKLSPFSLLQQLYEEEYRKEAMNQCTYNHNTKN